MSDLKDGENADKKDKTPKVRKPREPRASRQPGATAAAKEAATPSFEAKIAKGYKSPIEQHWATHVDDTSEIYAFLEIEQRDFDRHTGRKVSKPSIVSYNKSDLISFVGFGLPKAKDGREQQKSMKEMNGFSINAVLHVPSNFNVPVEVDEWPERD